MWFVLIQSILLCTLVTFSEQHHEAEKKDHADVHCGVPGKITHGHFDYLTAPDKDSYLAVIKYHCDQPIFALQNSNEAVYVCTEENKWKNAVLGDRPPECHKATCEFPKDIEHGHFDYVTTHGQTTHLSAIKYVCDANYHEKHFSDEGVYVCTIEGKWKNTDMGEELPVCEKVVCGQPLEEMHVHQRMVGGKFVVHGASPWSVLLVNLEGEMSNGALIDHHWVLSSYHAVHSNHTAEEIEAGLKVYVGVEDRREVNAAHEAHVEHIYLQTREEGKPEYWHDIALIKLKEEIVFGNHIMPICLPAHNYAEEGKVGFVAGWGMGLTKVAPTHLHYLSLSTSNATECHHHFEEHHPHLFPEDFSNYFCTEHTELDENLCNGDLGAPFVVNDNGTFYVAGVVSYDKACKIEKYAVYANVFNLHTWIDEVITNHST